MKCKGSCNAQLGLQFFAIKSINMYSVYVSIMNGRGAKLNKNALGLVECQH